MNTSFQKLSLHDVIPSPWKNGGGITYQLAIFPTNSTLDNFIWRVSIASINSNGPFSIFSNIDRVLLLLQGAGVELYSTTKPENPKLLHTMNKLLDPYYFKGEESIASVLMNNQQCMDFNVMTHREKCNSSVKVLRWADFYSSDFSTSRDETSNEEFASKPYFIEPCDHFLLFCAHGQWKISSPLFTGHETNAAEYTTLFAEDFVINYASTKSNTFSILPQGLRESNSEISLILVTICLESNQNNADARNEG